jgi:hypothetical protein
MMILAADVDKICVPFKRISSFAQRRPLVKASAPPQINTDFHRQESKSIGSSNTWFHPCESVLMRGYFFSFAPAPMLRDTIEPLAVGQFVKAP